MHSPAHQAAESTAGVVGGRMGGHNDVASTPGASSPTSEAFSAVEGSAMAGGLGSQQGLAHADRASK